MSNPYIDALLQQFEQQLEAESEAKYGQLQLENAELRRQNAALRQMIPLLKGRLDAFLVWFQGTVDSLH